MKTSKQRRLLSSIAITGLLVLNMVWGAFTYFHSGTAHASRPATKLLSQQVVQFKMIASPGIKDCLPNASAEVKITQMPVNDSMEVSVNGLPATTGFDLFVIELPTKPFGVSWYQSDLETGISGEGSATVQGIFNKETFSISPGSHDNPSITFAPTHQFHLGLWFNDPEVPFKLGCEPGKASPVVTPFNGEQHAGIQVLNTGNFPDNAGPLSLVNP